MRKKIIDFFKKLWAWLNEDDEPPHPTPAYLRIKDLFYKYEKIAETAAEFLNMKNELGKEENISKHIDFLFLEDRLTQQLESIGKTIHRAV